MPLFRFKCTFKEHGEYVGGTQRMVFGHNETEARNEVIKNTNMQGWGATSMLVTHIGHYWIPTSLWQIFKSMPRATVGETDDPATTEIQYAIIGLDLDGYALCAHVKHGDNLRILTEFERMEEGLIPTWSRDKMPISEFRVTGLGAFRREGVEAVYLDLPYRDTAIFPNLHSFWR